MQNINWIEFGGFFNDAQTVDWDYPEEPDCSEAEIAQFGKCSYKLWKDQNISYDEWASIRKWSEENLPEWKEYNAKCDVHYAKCEEFRLKTFSGMGLSKPGTLVEFVDERNEPWFSLLGSNNCYLTGGDFFQSDYLRVVKYAKIIDLEKDFGISVET